MDSSMDTKPALSARGVRVLAEACAQNGDATVVIMGHDGAAHGRLVFSHGARVRLRLTRPVSEEPWVGSRCVLSLLWGGRAYALHGYVRDQSADGVSLDLEGDLLGADPRKSQRQVVPWGTQVRLAWANGEESAELVDLSRLGIGVVVDGAARLLVVGARVVVRYGEAEVDATVCHAGRGPGTGTARLGLVLAGTEVQLQRWWAMLGIAEFAASR